MGEAYTPSDHGRCFVSSLGDQHDEMFQRISDSWIMGPDKQESWDETRLCLVFIICYNLHSLD